MAAQAGDEEPILQKESKGEWEDVQNSSTHIDKEAIKSKKYEYPSSVAFESPKTRAHTTTVETITIKEDENLHFVATELVDKSADRDFVEVPPPPTAQIQSSNDSNTDLDGDKSVKEKNELSSRGDLVQKENGDEMEEEEDRSIIRNIYNENKIEVVFHNQTAENVHALYEIINEVKITENSRDDLVHKIGILGDQTANMIKETSAASDCKQHDFEAIPTSFTDKEPLHPRSFEKEICPESNRIREMTENEELALKEQSQISKNYGILKKVAPIFSSDEENVKSEGICSFQNEKKFMIADDIENPRPCIVENETEKIKNSDGENLEEVCEDFWSDNARYDISRAMCVDEANSATAMEDRNALEQETTRIGNKNENRNQKEEEINVNNSNAPNLQFQNHIGLTIEERSAEELQKTYEVVQNKDEFQVQEVTQDETAEIDAPRYHTENPHIKIPLELLNQTNICEQEENNGSKQIILFKNGNGVAEARTIDEKINTDEEQKRSEEHNESNGMQLGNKTSGENMQLQNGNGTSTKDDPDDVIEASRCKENLEITTTEDSNVVIVSEIDASIVEQSPEKIQILQKESEEPAKKPELNDENTCSILDYKDEKMYASLMEASTEAAGKESRDKIQIFQESKENVTAKNPESSIEFASSIPDYTEEEVNTPSIDASIKEVTADGPESSAKNARIMPDHKDEKMNTLSICASIEESSEKESPEKMQILEEEVQEVVTADKSASSTEHSRSAIDYKVEKVNTLLIDASIEEETEKESLEETQIHQEESGAVITDEKPSTENTNTLPDKYEDGRVNTSLINASFEEAAQKESIGKTQIHQEGSEEIVTAEKPPSSSENSSMPDNKDKKMNTSLIDASTEYADESGSPETTLLRQEESEELVIVEKPKTSTEKVREILNYEDEKVDTSSISALIKEATEKELAEETQTLQAKSEEMVMAEKLASNTKNQTAADYYDEKMKTSSTRVSMESSIERPIIVQHYEDEKVNTSIDASTEEVTKKESLVKTQTLDEESTEYAASKELESSIEIASSIPDYKDEKVNTSSVDASIEEVAEKESPKETRILQEKTEEVAAADEQASNVENTSSMRDYEISMTASSKTQVLHGKIEEVVKAGELTSVIEKLSNTPNYEDEKTNKTTVDASTEDVAEKDSQEIKIQKRSEENLTAEKPESSSKKISSILDFEDEKVNASIDVFIEDEAEKGSQEETIILDETSEDAVTAETLTSKIENPSSISVYEDEITSLIDAFIKEAAKKREDIQTLEEESKENVTDKPESSTELASGVADYEDEKENTSSIDPSIETEEKGCLEKTLIFDENSKEVITAEKSTLNVEILSRKPDYEDEKVNTSSVDASSEVVEKVSEERIQVLHKKCKENVTDEKPESNIEFASSTPEYEDENVNISSTETSIEDAVDKGSLEKEQVLQEKSEVVTAEEPTSNIENPINLLDYEDEKVNTSLIERSVEEADEARSLEKTQILQQYSEQVVTVEEPIFDIENPSSIPHYKDERVSTINASSIDISTEEAAEDAHNDAQLAQKESEEILTFEKLQQGSEKASSVSHYEDEKVNTSSIYATIEEAAENGSQEITQRLEEKNEVLTADKPIPSIARPIIVENYEDEKVNTSTDASMKEVTKKESQGKAQTLDEESTEFATAKELESSIQIASSIPDYNDEKVNTSSMGASTEEAAEKESSKETQILQEKTEEVVTAYEPALIVQNPSSMRGFNDEKVNTASIDASIGTAERESPEETQTLQEESKEILTIEKSESSNQTALHYNDGKMNTSSTDASIEEDAEKESPEETEIFQKDSKYVTAAQDLASSTESQRNIANHNEKKVNTLSIDASIVEVEKVLLEETQILHVECEESDTTENPKSSNNNTSSIQVFEDEKMNTLSMDSYNEEATEMESQERTDIPQEDSDVVIAVELESNIEIASSMPDYDDEKVIASSMDASIEKMAEKESPKETQILQEKSEDVVTADGPTSNVENPSCMRDFSDEKVNTEESKEILAVDKSESSIHNELHDDDEKMNTSLTDASIEEDAEKEAPEKKDKFQEDSEDVTTAQDLASSTTGESNIANHDEKKVNTLPIDASIVAVAEKVLLEETQILHVECEESATAENPKSSTNNTSSIPTFEDENKNTLSIYSFNEEATEVESQERTHMPQEDSDIVITEELESSTEIASSLLDYNDEKVIVSSMDASIEEAAEKESPKETQITQEKSEEVVTTSEQISDVENPSNMQHFSDGKVNTASIDASVGTAEREPLEETKTLQEESKEILAVDKAESSIQTALHCDEDKMNTSSTDASIEEDAEKEAPEKKEIFQEDSEDVTTAQDLASSTTGESNIANHDEEKVNTLSIDASIVEVAEKVLLEETPILHVECEESATEENPKSSTNNTSSIPVFEDENMNTLSIDSYNEEATEVESQERTHIPQEDSEVVMAEEPESSTEIASSLRDYDDEQVIVSSMDASIEEVAEKESPKETQIIQEKSEEVVQISDVENPSNMQHFSDEKVNTTLIDASVRTAEEESLEETKTLQEESKEILAVDKTESSIQTALHCDEEKMNTSSTNASIEEDAVKEAPEKKDIFQEDSEDVTTAQDLASSTTSASNIANQDEEKVNTLSIDASIVEVAEKVLLEETPILHVECDESATADPKSSTNNTSSIPTFEDENKNTLSIDSFNEEAIEVESQERTHIPQEDSDAVIAEEPASSIEIASSLPGYDDEKVIVSSMDASIEKAAEKESPKETQIIQEKSEEVETAYEPTSNIENPSSMRDFSDEKVKKASIDTSAGTAERESLEETQTLQEESKEILAVDKSESSIQNALLDDEKMNTSLTDASVEEDAEKESPKESEIFQKDSEDTTAQDVASSTESESIIANHDEKQVNTLSIDASIVEEVEKVLLEETQVPHVECEESATAENPKSSTNNVSNIPVFEDEKINTLSIDSYNEEATEVESQEKTHIPQEDCIVVVAVEKVIALSMDASIEEEDEKETQILQEKSEEVVTAEEPTPNVENPNSMRDFSDEKVNTASNASVGIIERESPEETQTLQEGKKILAVDKSKSSIQTALYYDHEKMNTSSTDASIYKDTEKELPEKTKIFQEESEDVITAQNLASRTESQGNIAIYDEEKVNTLSRDASIVKAEEVLLQKTQILHVEGKESATEENPKSSTNKTSIIPAFKDEKTNTLSIDSSNEEATEEESEEKRHTPQEHSDVVIAEEPGSSTEKPGSIPDCEDEKKLQQESEVAKHIQTIATESFRTEPSHPFGAATGTGESIIIDEKSTDEILQSVVIEMLEKSEGQVFVEIPSLPKDQTPFSNDSNTYTHSVIIRTVVQNEEEPKVEKEKEENTKRVLCHEQIVKPVYQIAKNDAFNEESKEANIAECSTANQVHNFATAADKVEHETQENSLYQSCKERVFEVIDNAIEEKDPLCIDVVEKKKGPGNVDLCEITENEEFAQNEESRVRQNGIVLIKELEVKNHPIEQVKTNGEETSSLQIGYNFEIKGHMQNNSGKVQNEIKDATSISVSLDNRSSVTTTEEKTGQDQEITYITNQEKIFQKEESDANNFNASPISQLPNQIDLSVEEGQVEELEETSVAVQNKDQCQEKVTCLYEMELSILKSGMQPLLVQNEELHDQDEAVENDSQESSSKNHHVEEALEFLDHNYINGEKEKDGSIKTIACRAESSKGEARMTGEAGARISKDEYREGYDGAKQSKQTSEDNTQIKSYRVTTNDTPENVPQVGEAKENLKISGTPAGKELIMSKVDASIEEADDKETQDTSSSISTKTRSRLPDYEDEKVDETADANENANEDLQKDVEDISISNYPIMDKVKDPIVNESEGIQNLAKELIHPTTTTNDSKDIQIYKESVEAEKLSFVSNFTMEEQNDKPEETSLVCTTKDKEPQVKGTEGIQINEGNIGDVVCKKQEDFNTAADEQVSEINDVNSDQETANLASNVILDDQINENSTRPELTSDINHVNIGDEPPKEIDDDVANSASDVLETNDLAAQFMHAAANNHDIIMHCKCREEFQEISKLKFCITEDDNIEEARQMLESSADLAQEHKNEKRNSKIMSQNSKNDANFSSEIIDENTIIENEESDRMKQSLLTQSTEASADKEFSLIQNDQETTKHDEGTHILQYQERSLQKEDRTQHSDFDKGKNEKETAHCEGLAFTGNKNESEIQIEKSDVSYIDASCAQSSKQVESIMEERNPKEFQETYEFVHNNNQCNEVIREEMELPSVEYDIQTVQAPNEKVNDQEEAVDKHIEIIPNKISDVQESPEMVVIQKLIQDAEKISRENNFFSENETCAAEAKLSYEKQSRSNKEKRSNEMKQDKQTSEGSVQIKTHHDIPAEQTLESAQETPGSKENIEIYSIEILSKSIKNETGASVDKHTASAEHGHPEHPQEKDEAVLISDPAEARICTEDTSTIPDREDKKTPEMVNINYESEATNVMDEDNLEKNVEYALEVEAMQVDHEECINTVDKSSTVIPAKEEEIQKHETAPQHQIQVLGFTEDDKNYVGSLQDRSKVEDIYSAETKIWTQIIKLESSCDENITDVQEDSSSIKRASDANSTQINVTELKSVAYDEVSGEDNGEQELETILREKEREDENQEEDNNVEAEEKPCGAATVNVYNKEIAKENITAKRIPDNQKLDYVDAEISLVAPYELDIADKCTYTDKEYQGDHAEKNLENEEMPLKLVGEVRSIILCGNEIQASDAIEYLSLQEQVLKLANSDVTIDYNHSKIAGGLSIMTEFVGARSLPQINILGFESLETESYNRSGLKFQDNPTETMQLKEQPNQLQIADPHEKTGKSMAKEDLVQAPVSDEANVANEHFLEKDNEVKKIELRPTLEDNKSITTSKEAHRNMVSETEVSFNKDMTTNIFDMITSAADEHEVSENSTRESAMDIKTKEVNTEAANAVCRSGGKFDINEAGEEHPGEMSISVLQRVDSGTIDQEDRVNRKEISKSVFDVCTTKEKNPSVEFMEDKKHLGNLTNKQATKACILNEEEKLEQAERPSYEVAYSKGNEQQIDPDNLPASHLTDHILLSEHGKHVEPEIKVEEISDENDDASISKQENNLAKMKTEQGTKYTRGLEDRVSKLEDSSDPTVEHSHKPVSLKSDTDKRSSAAGMDRGIKEASSLLAEGTKESTKFISGNKMEFSSSDAGELSHVQDDEKIQASIVGRTIAISVHNEDENQKNGIIQKRGKDDTIILKETEKKDLVSNTQIDKQQSFVSKQEGDIKVLENGEERLLNLQSDEIMKLKSSNFDNSAPQIKSRGIQIVASKDRQTNEEMDTHQDEDIIDDENDEHEGKDEHAKTKRSHDLTLVAESKDAHLKPANKKSHNILSGVGSKVKRSIAKVKKVITGKTSHSKTASPP